MNVATGIREKIFGSPGYSADLALSLQELSVFRDAIEEQWLSTIESKYPEHVSTFGRHGISTYHQHSHLIDHEKLWSKEQRLLSQEKVEKIRRLPFMQKLQEFFGDFTISDVVYGNTIIAGKQEIYWRIVRPNRDDDVGPLHIDKWFHDVLGSDGGMFPPGVVTVKIWIPICCEPGKSGLVVVPDSHAKEWCYEYVEKNGVLKPEIRENVKTLNCYLVPTEPGTLLMFNERLLHGGAINRGEMTRVSAEITMVFQPGALN